MLTLEQFRRTAVRHDVSVGVALPAELQHIEDMIEGDRDSVSAVYVYELGCFIEVLRSGECHLTLDRGDYTGDRADLEAMLYRDFYAYEAA